MERDDEAPRSGVLLAAIVGFACAIGWFLIALVAHYRFRFVAIAAGYLIGTTIRRDIRSSRDVRVPVISCVIGFATIMLGEYLLTTAFAPELSEVIGRKVTPPLGPFEFFFLLAQTADGGAVGFWLAAAAVSFAVPARSLRQADFLENTVVVREEQRELAERLRDRRDEPSRPRATGSARVRCASCDEMVDSNTTTQTERGIVCEDCLVQSEGEANRSASYRD